MLTVRIRTHTHRFLRAVSCTLRDPASHASLTAWTFYHTCQGYYYYFVRVTSAVMNTPLSRPPPQGRLHRKLIVISHGCILYGYTCHRCTIIEIYMHEKCTLSNIHGYPSWLHITR